MAGGNKEAAVALKEAGESSNKPTEKSKEDPLKTFYDTDDSDSGEDPSWMFYDTDDSPYYVKDSDDDEPKTKKPKTDGGDSDDDETKAKKVKTDGKVSDDDEPKTMKFKTDDEASVSSKGKEAEE